MTTFESQSASHRVVDEYIERARLARSEQGLPEVVEHAALAEISKALGAHDVAA